MSPLSVPNCSLIGARIRRILQSVRKEVEEKKNQTLAARISEMAGVIFFKFGISYLAGISAATLVLIGLRITELQRYENRVYFFL